MTMRPPVRIIDARTGEIRWNWDSVEDAHISHLYDKGEVDLRRLSKRKAAEVVEYMAAHESINKAANACITLTDEEIELLTNYAELSGDEASYLRVLCFMLKEGLYDNCVLWLPMTRNLRAGINDTDTEVYDRSPFGNHGTIHGAVWQTLPSGKSALSFDGVDDYVEVPDSPSLNIDYGSFEIWIKFNELNKDVEQDFFSKQGGSLSGWGFYNPKNSNKLGFILVTTEGYTAHYFLTATTGVWYHIVGTYDGTRKRVYVNGEKKLDTEVSGKIVNNPDIHVHIGSYPGGSYPVNGLIDEVRIYSRALSEDEIRRLYELTRVFYGV